MINYRIMPAATLCLLAMLATQAARAVPVDFTTLEMTPDSNLDTLLFSAGGVTGQVRGYHVEITDTSPGGKIYGPFSTATALDTPSWIYPYFGRVYKKSDATTTGLMLLSKENLGQTDFDSGSAVIAPGFDNRSYQTTDVPVFQFALFEFSAPVDVSRVVLGNAGNSPRPFWVAGSSKAPDIAAGFLDGFKNFEFRNITSLAEWQVNDVAITPLNGIRYLAVGTPPSKYEGISTSTFGPLEVVGDSQFYLNGLDYTPVPLPAAFWLFGSGLLGLLGLSRPTRRAVFAGTHQS